MGLAKAETLEQVPVDLYPAVCSKLEDTFRGVGRRRRSWGSKDIRNSAAISISRAMRSTISQIALHSGE